MTSEYSEISTSDLFEIRNKVFAESIFFQSLATGEQVAEIIAKSLEQIVNSICIFKQMTRH